jgi:hypothetical protein
VTLPPPGSGFALLNAPALLDAPGEWYFDRGSKSVYLLWPASRPAPAEGETEMVVVDPRQRDAPTHADAALAFWGGDQPPPANFTLRISNLTIVRSTGHAVRIVRAPNVTLSRLRLNQPGRSGIYLTEATGQVLVEQSTILNAADNGLLVTASRDVTIRGNTITDAGQVANQRQFATDFNGVRAGGFERIVVSDNEIAGVGFAGIMLAEPASGDPLADRVKIEITKNRIASFCDLLNDCGAIYINGRQKQGAPLASGPRSDKLIAGNQIKMPRGNLDGSPGMTAGKEKVKSGNYIRMIGAVYLDHQASGYDIADNQIAGQYEPYGWRIFNKGVLNSCSRSVASDCAAKGGFTCYNNALDNCNSAPR